MSIPSKATIDNLPPSVSQRYAIDELSKKSPGLYPDISSISPQARPQVVVLEPILTSQLETLTGALGKTHTLALFSPPSDLAYSDIFSFGVFPKLATIDKDVMLSRISGLETENNLESLSKVKTALETISFLNTLGLESFSKIRQLKQG
jgi:hypothetical protein